MPEVLIPDAVYKLKRPRRMILVEYFKLLQQEPRSDYYRIRQIAHKLDYKIDANGSNAYVMRVIREFRRVIGQ